MPSHVTHLESAIDGTRFKPGVPHTIHAGRPLWVRYDLDAVGAAVDRSTLRQRRPGLWRYRELLPVRDDANIVSLAETETPLVPCPRLGAALGVTNLWVKDESRLPGGSFKARGMAMAVTMANEFGLTRVAVPSAGNAGGALAAYAARAGMECFIFMPDDTPVVNTYEAATHGAHVFLVNGLINDCGAMIGSGTETMGWFDMSTLKEPYRIEGKKTMGLELADQMDWDLPDVVLYPTGGGTGLIGMWKAWEELGTLGWLDTEHRPRLYSCQSSGCAPIANAYDADERFADPIENAHTIASGLRVPKAVGDFMILDAVRASGGAARATDEDRLLHWMNQACALEGVALCPEAAACIGVLEAELASGGIGPDERIVIFNTGAVQKYVEAMQCELPRLDCTTPVDWATLV